MKFLVILWILNPESPFVNLSICLSRPSFWSFTASFISLLWVIVIHVSDIVDESFVSTPSTVFINLILKPRLNLIPFCFLMQYLIKNSHEYQVDSSELMDRLYLLFLILRIFTFLKPNNFYIKNLYYALSSRYLVV